MTRLLAACAALVAAVGAARAADPQPLWEIDTAAEKLRPRGVWWVGFSPDDKVLVARVEYVQEGKGDPPVNIPTQKERLLAWDTKSRKELFKVELGRGRGLNPGFPANAVTPDGTVLVPESEKEVRLSDGQTRFLAPLIMRTEGVWANRTTRDTVWLAPDGEDGDRLITKRLSAFDADPKRPVADNWSSVKLPTVKDGYYVRSVAVSPDTKLVAVATEDPRSSGIPVKHALGLYALMAGEKAKLTEVAAVPGSHPGRICATQFSPDGKTLATGSQDSSIALWDVTKAGKDWKPFATIPAGNYDVWCLVFSPDGRTLAAGTYERKGKPNLFIIDVRAGKLVSSHALGEAVMAVAYSADGKLLVTGHSGGKVRVWEAAALRGD